MYALPTRLELRLRTNDGLRKYSRLEYGTPDAAWLLVAASRVPRKPRRKTHVARWLRRLVSSRTTPAGLPRLPEDCPARA
ncbi:MAG: hypothetical protein WC985_06030 [Thermoplasmata archaeon]